MSYTESDNKGNQAWKDVLAQAEDLHQLADNESDPGTQQQLRDQADQLVQEGAKEITDQYLKDTGKAPYWNRGK